MYIVKKYFVQTPTMQCIHVLIKVYCFYCFCFKFSENSVQFYRKFDIVQTKNISVFYRNVNSYTNMRVYGCTNAHDQTFQKK